MTEKSNFKRKSPTVPYFCSWTPLPLSLNLFWTIRRQWVNKRVEKVPWGTLVYNTGCSTKYGDLITLSWRRSIVLQTTDKGKATKSLTNKDKRQSSKCLMPITNTRQRTVEKWYKTTKRLTTLLPPTRELWDRYVSFYHLSREGRPPEISI